MPSEIDIANLALARLGDDATVSNFNPPEGSAQAEHCARFYPIARDSLLEQHDWGFATRRAVLAEVSAYADPIGEWTHAYALPNLCIKPIEVRPQGAAANLPLTSYPMSTVNEYGNWIGVNGIEFTVETDTSGNKVLLTNQPNAAVVYLMQTTDTNKFSPLFVDTLAWYLAGYLAGPILKGEVGRAEAKGNFAIAMSLMGKATLSDANQRHKAQRRSNLNSITGSR